MCWPGRGGGVLFWGVGCCDAGDVPGDTIIGHVKHDEEVFAMKEAEWYMYSRLFR